MQPQLPDKVRQDLYSLSSQAPSDIGVSGSVASCLPPLCLSVTVSLSASASLLRVWMSSSPSASLTLPCLRLCEVHVGFSVSRETPVGSFGFP